MQSQALQATTWSGRVQGQGGYYFLILKRRGLNTIRCSRQAQPTDS